MGEEKTEKNGLETVLKTIAYGGAVVFAGVGLYTGVIDRNTANQHIALECALATSLLTSIPIYYAVQLAREKFTHKGREAKYGIKY